MKNRKKILSVAIVVLLVAALVIGATWAFFTDKDTKTNTFTMGKGVDLTLTEEVDAVTEGDVASAGVAKEDGSGFEFKDAYPGQKFHKEPVVTVGSDSRDTYLIATVTLNNYSKLKLKLQGNDDEFYGELFTGGVTAWTPYANGTTGSCFEGVSGYMFENSGNKVFITTTVDAANDKVTYTYYFLDKLTAGDSYSLFDRFVVPTAITSYDGWFNSQTMVVNVYGIQVETFANVKEAWAAYNGAQ